MALFHERGYADVTVAEIAHRAGLTKRTFFNHFSDKREVLFAGATSFEVSVIQHLSESGDDLTPIDAAVGALTLSGLELARYRTFAQVRRELIASSPELQERDLIKMTSLAAAIAQALSQRHVSSRTATLTAQAALAVFNTAYVDWVDDPAADLDTLMQRALADLRLAVVATVAPAEAAAGKGAGR